MRNTADQASAGESVKTRLVGSFEKPRSTGTAGQRGKGPKIADMSSKDELKKQSPYKCSLCDRAFPERAELEAHQSTSHRDALSV